MILLNDFTFGFYICERRVELDLSAAELAARAGVPLADIELYEDAIGDEPSISTLVQLADALEVRVSDLVGALGYE